MCGKVVRTWMENLFFIAIKAKMRFWRIRKS